jgi:hypothetical protein
MPMRLSEIREISLRQFAEAQESETSESTPSAVTLAVETFARSLGAGGPVYVPVVHDRHGLYGFCNDGVAQKILSDGGSVAFGWTIWEWSALLLTAEFHALWRDDAGALLDITPKPGREDRILFVHDPKYTTDFNFDRRPRNRRMRALQDPDQDAAISAIRDKLAGGQLRYEEKRAAKANLSLHDCLKCKIPIDPLVEAIDELIEACDDFDEHFDSLGVAGRFKPGDKLLRLAKRRYLAQDAMKALARSRGV